MRDLACCSLVCLAILAESGCSSVPPTARAFPPLDQPQLPRILVGFWNEPLREPHEAGTTGWRYRGGGYLITQKGRRAARRLAVAYSLRVVASWPLKRLAADCVVYEVPTGRSPSDLLSVLATDPQVAFAQPLQQFQTQTIEDASVLTPD